MIAHHTEFNEEWPGKFVSDLVTLGQPPGSFPDEIVVDGIGCGSPFRIAERDDDGYAAEYRQVGSQIKLVVFES
jgi:hypothetical protein